MIKLFFYKFVLKLISMSRSKPQLVGLNSTFRVFAETEKNRVGNTLIYLAERISDLSKTKLLKLVYLLDVYTTKQTGIPFLGLRYEVWRMGPVNQDLYAEFSSSSKIFDNYVDIDNTGAFPVIRPKKSFEDDEFSDQDIDILDAVIEKYGAYQANELSLITHKPGGLWDTAAEKNGLKDFFNNSQTHTTNCLINLKDLLDDDVKKQKYEGYLEDERIQQTLNA